MTRLRPRSGSASMIGLLISTAIVLVAVWWIWLRPAGGVEKPKRFANEATNPIGSALQRGQSVDDMNNIKQLGLAIQMEKDQTGSYPAALDPKWGIPLKSGVSGYDYKYDPTTGRVWDPTPGHEAYTSGGSGAGS
jgi:hypothetical protein